MDAPSSSATTEADPTSAITFDWAHTECLLTQCPVLPTCKLPDDCWQTNSLIVDKSDTHFTDAQIFKLFKNTAIGTSFQPKQQYLQLFFPDNATVEQTLAHAPFSIQGCTLPVFLPKGKLPPRLII